MPLTLATIDLTALNSHTHTLIIFIITIQSGTVDIRRGA